MFMASHSETFSKELENMVKIGENRCPNIVQFLGTCRLQGGKQGLVMELFEKNLLEYVNPPLTWHEGRLILRQIANGLRHLKNLNIVHRDVKPENILVKTDENGMIKVALTDLGVSKHMTKTQRSNQTNIGTDLWMAPEIKGDKPTYGHPADVFGFGLTAVYILTGQYPLGRDVKPDELDKWIGDCYEYATQAHPVVMFMTLIYDCLEYDPTKRISKSALIDHEVSSE